MKNILLSYRAFCFGFKLCGFFARRPNFNKITHLLMRKLADLNFRMRSGRPQGKKSINEIGELWENMFPVGKVKIRRCAENTIYADVIVDCCPVIESNNLKACYRLMEYDRRLLEHIGGQFIILESRAKLGVTVCKVAIRKEGVSIEDLVPACKKDYVNF